MTMSAVSRPTTGHAADGPAAEGGGDAFDLVGRAAHYNAGGIEAVEAIEAALSPEEFRGWLKGNVIKYLWRAPHKGSERQDYEKCRYYLNRLIGQFTEGEAGE